MGNASTKKPTNISADNVLRYAYNVNGKTMGVDGFIVGKVGHKITREVVSTNQANDTERYTFLDDGVVLYILDIVYATADLETMLSVERIQ